jgi:DNA polymerase III subunit epsilon
MILLPFDTETTGLPRKDLELHHPSQPHMVSISALQVDENQRIVQSISLRVQPDGWEWDDQSPAFGVHQITMEEAAKGIPERNALDLFLQLWDNTAHPIAHNLNFDRQIIAIAIARYYPESPALLEAWQRSEGTCTMSSSAPHVGATTANGRKKQPNLKEAYQWATGEELERHHSANSDAVACLHIYMALQQQDHYNL